MVNKFSRIFVILFVIGVVTLIIRGYRAKYDIVNNGKIIIGSYLSHRKHPKTSSNYFIFYVNGKKCERDAGRVPQDLSLTEGNFINLDIPKSMMRSECFLIRKSLILPKSWKQGLTQKT